MLNVTNTEQSWDQVDRQIGRWLKERQELIVLYCKVDGLKELMEEIAPLSVRVQALCNTLIDYVSAAHFEIYKQLMVEAQQYQEDYQPVFNELLPVIQESTELALDFNDRYGDALLEEEDLERLSKDLNQLGLKMVERFELEDKLIDQLHNCHRELVA